MAILRHEATGAEERLSNEHTAGRSSACLLRLRDRRASGLHAMFRWSGEAWELADLGSRNGIWINDGRLSAGQRQVLAQGDRIGFGQQDDRWVLDDASPPVLMARTPGGPWHLADDGLLALPSPGAPSAIVYAGDDGRWLVEQDSEVAELDQLDFEVEVDGQRWQVRPPAAAAQTHAATQAQLAFTDELAMIFFVSQDEEDVEIEVRAAGHAARVPHRAQNYLLLTLARARLEDTSADLPESEQGWRYGDDLARALRIPDNQFNVAIYRARQHLQKAGVAEARKVVERRRGSGQLRLGASQIHIEAL